LANKRNMDFLSYFEGIPSWFLFPAKQHCCLIVDFRLEDRENLWWWIASLFEILFAWKRRLLLFTQGWRKRKECVFVCLSFQVEKK
jgi:hypothetical protein